MTPTDTPANPEAWRRALDAWAGLGDAEPDARRDALESLRRSDPDAHACVLELQRADGDAPAAFLKTRTDSKGPQPEGADLTGRSVGPWTVVRELGAGGMGRVWLAQRADGRYDGQVAIKLPRASVAQGALGARFEREGRILGALAHPGIARLVDAGTLDDGQPYLVLEYVEGERIDAWCDRRRLGIRERVELFSRVCEAVAYAHANLVVHRDLKPSNILVTPAGEVKLLDFGIAKLVDADDGAAEETEITRAAGHALTPEYAAPEQVLAAPITTATDVYALGVVLYRLLCGQSPYRRDDGTRPSAFELQKDIVEREPRRLSLATLAGADAAGLGQLAAQRSESPRRLRSLLEGDLENIVARALRKDPAQRYGSAQALRDDLRRHLEHRPVEARGDGAGYVFARFVRRHRLAVAGAALLVIAVLAGVGGVAWQSRIARIESEKARAVSAFLTGIFTANSTANADPAKARSTTARELLDIGRARASRDLAGNPEVLQEVLGVIGQLHYELGLMDEASKVDIERIEVVKKLDGPRGRRYAEAIITHGNTLTSLGDFKRAQALAEEGLARLEEVGDRDSISRGLALATVANAQRYTDPSKSLEATRAAVAFFEAHHPDTQHNMNMLRSLAIALHERGDYAASTQAITRAIAVGERVLGPEQRPLAFIHQIAGNAYSSSLQPGLAVASYRRAIAIDEKAVGPASTLRPVLEANLARAELGGPGWKASRERLQAVAAKLDLAKPAERRNAAFVIGALATVLAQEGDVAGARQAYAAVMPTYREVIPKPLVGGLVASAAELELVAGDTPKARAWLAELEPQRATTFAKLPTLLARIDELEAQVLLAEGKPGEALALLRAAPPVPRTQPHPLDEAARRLVLARALAATGDVAAAEKDLRALLATIEGHADHAWFAHLEAQASVQLAQLLAASGRFDEATPRMNRAVALLEERQVASSPRLVRARAAQAAIQARKVPS